MDRRRLRDGEWTAAAGAIVLLVALLAWHWYAVSPLHARFGWWSYPPLSSKGYAPARDTLVHALGRGPLTGWQALPTLRWFVLVTVALGLALALAQAACRGPALPVTLDLVAMLVGTLTTLLLLIRLATTPAPLRFGAVVGLLAAAAVARGAFRALRVEQGWRPDPGAPPGGPGAIEVVDLGPPSPAS
jgi:hypothetical protein